VKSDFEGAAPVSVEDTQAVRHDRLLGLYGPAEGEYAAAELDDLLARFRPRLAARKPPAHPSGNQALLITYGDTLLGGRESPLAALREFARRHLKGRLSGIHLLPFFPSSSDYGFAVEDYLAVRDDLGSWADVEALGADFRLMFDFVLNHVSAESEWFPSATTSSPSSRRQTCRQSRDPGRRRC
jgi:glucosylglycerate phosphorylase